jgi:UPF0755 protein
MKRILKLLGLLSGSSLLIIILIFVIQSSSNNQHTEVFIKKSWSQEEFESYISNEFNLSLPLGMTYWAKKVGFKIQTSRFILPPHTSAWKFLKLLRENRNQTVNVVIPPGIYAKELKQILLRNFDINPNMLEEIWNNFENNDNFDDDYWSQFDVNKYTWPTLIIPNTYNFSRNTGIDIFFKRMQNEQSLFWNAERKQKLRKQKLDINEAITLASIVQKESLKVDEYEEIAGVYLNRLRINMFLGADPTLVFIRGRGGRVYNKDMNIVSPYNTYRNKGLPPGPICIPSKQAIDAVLNYTEHPYLYFCAKSDLSGYHAFARHYTDHLKNARLFQKKLNELERKKSGR